MKLYGVLAIVIPIILVVCPLRSQVWVKQNTDSVATREDVYLDRDDLWGQYYSGIYFSPNSFLTKDEQHIYRGTLGVGVSEVFLFHLQNNFFKSIHEQSYIPKINIGVRLFPFLQIDGSYEDPDVTIFNERTSNSIFNSFDKLEYDANPNWSFGIQMDSKWKGRFNVLYHPALMYQFPNQPYLHVLNENGLYANFHMISGKFSMINSVIYQLHDSNEQEFILDKANTENKEYKFNLVKSFSTGVALKFEMNHQKVSEERRNPTEPEFSKFSVQNFELANYLYSLLISQKKNALISFNFNHFTYKTRTNGYFFSPPYILDSDLILNPNVMRICPE